MGSKCSFRGEGIKNPLQRSSRVERRVSPEVMQARLLPLQPYKNYLVNSVAFQPDKMTTTFTPRETEVFNAILAGDTAAKDIARKFQIKQNTAKNHIQRIRQKTGVRKAALPRWAAENGGNE